MWWLVGSRSFVRFIRWVIANAHSDIHLRRLVIANAVCSFMCEWRTNEEWALPKQKKGGGTPVPCYPPRHVSPGPPSASACASEGIPRPGLPNTQVSSLSRGTPKNGRPVRSVLAGPAPSTVRPLARGPRVLVGWPLPLGLVWTGACYWHGVGGSMFYSS